MDAIEMIKGRRSVRQYKNEVVDRELMKEIVSLAQWAPSWANFQVARYTLIDDPKTIAKITADGVKGFAYNMNTLKEAKGVAVISFVKGKSGKLPDNHDYATNKGNSWEVFDAGIACQTFCLAAHAKGVATCIFGLIDDENIAKIANLPETETVAAIVVYGYSASTPPTTLRKDISEILRFA